ncbi:TPA: hypothetical protein LU109_003567 [Enterobacter hormaechei subsp. xiangfangensis]|nr:hypothetical protein [Enterobacter hormaechei subsp. xiangfangensis]
MARHKDDSLRIRLSRLTATSSACKRFITQHDKLEGAVRINRHVETIRLGQMLHELGFERELAFLDNEVWEKAKQPERLAMLLDVLRISGKLVLPDVQPNPPSSPVYEPVYADVEPKTPAKAPVVAPVAQPAVETPPAQPKPQKANVAPVAPRKPTAEVKQTEDGATFISESAPALGALPANLRNLAGGGA